MLLLGSLAGTEVAHSILNVELNSNLVAQACRAAVERAGLDAGHVRHDLELGVQAGAAVAAEEVLVNLARFADSIPGLGRACSLP